MFLATWHSKQKSPTYPPKYTINFSNKDNISLGELIKLFNKLQESTVNI